MKRILLALLGLAMLSGLALSASAAATLTQTWTITVSFSAYPIDLSATGLTASFGTVSANQVVYSNFAGGQPRSTIQNNGSGTISYTALATIAGGWTLAAAPGANTAVLQGIFTRALPVAEDAVTGKDMVAGLFGAEDVLTGVAQTATVNIFAENAEVLPATKGNNVDPTNSTRSMRYRFQAPTSATITVPQTISVVIGAV